MLVCGSSSSRSGGGSSTFSSGLSFRRECPREALAMIVCLGVNFLWGLFNGYVIVYTAIPVYWKWMNRISPTTWMLYGVVIDQLGDRSDVLVSGLTVSATRSYYPAVAGCYSTSSPTLY